MSIGSNLFGTCSKMYLIFNFVKFIAPKKVRQLIPPTLFFVVRTGIREKHPGSTTMIQGGYRYLYTYLSCLLLLVFPRCIYKRMNKALLRIFPPKFFDILVTLRTNRQLLANFTHPALSQPHKNRWLCAIPPIIPPINFS